MPAVEPLLTSRQIECLQLASQGKTSFEIARILGISEHTASHHLTDAQQRLETVNRAHAIATAIRRGLI